MTSDNWQARASKVTALGSATRSKARSAYYGQIDEPWLPASASYGRGSVVIDVDGSRWIDMVMALGAVGLGYRAQSRESLYYGDGVYSLPHWMEAKAGEIVLKHVAPWAEQVRFVKTGSEATQAACMISKVVTGRNNIVVMQGAYHGWHEWSQGNRPDIRHVRYGSDPESWFDGFGTRYLNAVSDVTSFSPNTLSAVVIEPARWQETDPEWLRVVVDATHRRGGLIVFDEMVYGGRWRLGGATELWGVIPDLACYGKAMANGMACAFVVGKDDVMRSAAMISGTYSGDTVGLSACVATIEEYAAEPIIETLWARGRQLQDGLRAVLANSGIGPDVAVLEGAPVHQRIRFAEPEAGYRFAAEMARRGVLWHPQVVNVSAAHTEAQIGTVIEAARESLAEVPRYA
jgi:glutamate-1-semialdehyde 2,1-aminomutase